MEVVALVNDTVGTLAAASFVDKDAAIGVILGTGAGPGAGGMHGSVACGRNLLAEDVEDSAEATALRISRAGQLQAVSFDLPIILPRHQRMLRGKQVRRHQGGEQERQHDHQHRVGRLYSGVPAGAGG